MKNLVLFFLITFSFAITDKLYKPQYKKVLYKTNSNLALLDDNKTDDKNNVYFYNDHFRVILGKDYNNSAYYKNLAKNILNISEYVWKKEVEELGFKLPINSDMYKIDIYIGNTNAYNNEKEKYESISSYYAGYATAYNNRTPYFVINPDISTDILKVTIAHEFFHTIQYAYGLDKVSDNIFYKNIWFVEASAVMMEDEVYDDVNDYVNYLNYYLPYTYKALDYYNGSIEYGKVLYAKFLKEKYGMEFIKKIFENYEINETILDDIKKTFKKENISFENSLKTYAKWIANDKAYFKDGNLYPTPRKYNTDSNILVGKYGFVLFNSSDNNNYLISSNIEYSQTTFNGDSNILDNISNTGLIFLAKISNLYTKNYIKLNTFAGINLKKGWNLISNSTSEELKLDDIFTNNELVWIYRDNKYYAFSNDKSFKNVILNLNIFTSFVKPSEAMWVYVKKDENLTLPISTLSDFNLSLKDGWNFISISSSAFDVNLLDKNLLIWHYNKLNKNWEIYYKKDLNISKIKYILPFEGYFVRKEEK